MRFWRVFTAIAVVTWVSGGVEVPGDWLARALGRHLEEFAAGAESQAQSVTTRDLTNAALLNLMNHGDRERTEAWIERAFATQDLRRGSATYGELKWKTGDSAITDLNAIEFGTQALGPLYLAYGDRLSAGFRERMRPHLTAALAGLHGHAVKVSYTNIFLMNLVSGLLIGQVTQDAAAVGKAEQELDDWLEYTRQFGIHEFDSPTYYSADLGSLVEGFRYAASPEDRRKFERALDYFWNDIAASFFPAAGRMVGAYSRDYDFLRGRGGMDVWLTEAGWATIPSKSVDFEKVFVLDNARAGGYRPSSAARALADRLPREVVSRWDEDPWHARFLWMGQGVSLGCTSGDYGAQDKLFNATFAGSPDMPQITVVPDVFDAPYGMVKLPDRTNHMKPTHLPLHAACVERGGVALITMDLDPTQLPDHAKGLATDIVLPAAAEIAVDGKRQVMTSAGVVAIDKHAVVTVTLGAAVVGLRILHVDGLPESEPTFALAADNEGLAHHAVRLKIAHLREGQTTGAKHLRIALLVAARDGAVSGELRRDLRHAEIGEGVSEKVWTVKATLPGVSLEIARSAGDRKMIGHLWIDGKPAPHAVLSVNGEDLAGILR